jgi:hypothetical protein
MVHTKYKMFPIRIEHQLADALDRFVKDTRTTKTEFAKAALTKLLWEFETGGVRQSVKELYTP